jgi:hypothetical protein
MINGESSFEHQLLHISVAEPVSQIPPHAEDDDLILEMSASEQRRSVPTHLTSPYQRARTSLQQSPQSNDRSTFAVASRFAAENQSTAGRSRSAHVIYDGP